MSSCNDYAEFLATLCLETGARPHVVAPLARRLRRLATTHQRRCEMACDGCRTCGGAGHVVPIQNSRMYLGRVEWTGMPHESRTDRKPCPTCSTDTVERAIELVASDLQTLRATYVVGERIGTFAPVFQGDPRGATVRLRVPSGVSDSWGGVAVPTSSR